MTTSRPLVLICDDEPVLRELIRVSLGPGYRFCEAGSVVESIRAFQTESPDAVVLDLMLVGGSGLDVLRAIRAAPSGKRTPVIVVSAWSDDANRAAVEEEGADLFLPKPFAPDQLAARIGELVGA
ncbi:MAG: response regulator transcription factor [Gaiellaceae bacterium]